jgi:hypothetical protein
MKEELNKDMENLRKKNPQKKVQDLMDPLQYSTRPLKKN